MLELELVHQRLEFLERQFKRCKTKEDLDKLWTDSKLNTLFKDDPEWLFSLGMDHDFKIWILARLRDGHDTEDAQFPYEVALIELEARKHMQHVIKVIESRNEKRVHRKGLSITGTEILDMPYVVKHFGLLRETEAKPETLEWLYKRLMGDADPDNKILIELLHEEQLTAHKRTVRGEVKNQFEEKPHCVGEVPPIVTRYPYRYFVDREKQQVLMLGTFQNIWSMMDTFRLYFHLPVDDEDIIAFKSGTPFVVGKDKNITFRFAENRGLEIMVHDDMIFEDVLQNLKIAIQGATEKTN